MVDIQRKFEFDVFVSYRWVDPDQGWVRDHLVPALEAAGLRVCLDVNDFVPGRDLMLEMARAGQSSRHGLCILSPDYFIGNRMVSFESLYMRRMDPGGLESRLIPLIFRSADLPEWLQGLIPVDWTDPRNRLREWRRLLRALGAPHDSPAPAPQETAQNSSAAAASSGKMPEVGTLAVGRESEFEWLDAAWKDRDTGVAALIALGGVGKTTVAWNWWLRLHSQFPRLRLQHFSFYDQGATAGSQASAEPFFTRAFDQWFKVARPASLWDQGTLLAEHVRNESIILILDGVEPLQHPHDPHFGYFADERMIALLQELAASGSGGLCVCTSRLPITHLNNYIGNGYRPRALDNLTPRHGAELLRKFDIQGTDKQLADASNSFGNHALSLTLLARYIAEYYADRDINRVDTIPPLSTLPIAEQGGHARRILRHYENIFPPQSPENALLRCIGLFDRPVAPHSLNKLKRAPAIEGLTEPLVGLSRTDHITALRKLKRLGLIDYEQPHGTLDCHPIIRAHFGNALRHNESAWRAANHRLFQHYATAAVQERPLTPEEMEPLYPAVVHACKAGAYAEAWHIYWDRIQQGHPRYFNTNVLGAFHAGLGSLASFYDPPWEKVAPGVEEALPRKDYLRLLTEVGFHIKTLGRFAEAREVYCSAIDACDHDSDYEQAAVNSENLAETYLLEGQVREALVALRAGHNDISFAELSLVPFRQMQTLALKGQILHYLGVYDAAEAALFEAEEIRGACCSERQPVRSLYLLDLLGELGRYEELFAIADRFRPLLDESDAKPFTSVFYSFVGQGHALHAIRNGDRSSAAEALKLIDTAKHLINVSMLPHLQPRAPCIRARLLTYLGEFEQAKADLVWSLAVAEHTRMRIFEVDCHLGLCELYLARGELIGAKRHLDEAQHKMAGGSYRRPIKWMEELSAKLSCNLQ
jgi:tetratricopeptide (TPR) repeat protein